MEDPYIYFELNNRKLKINRENSEDIWIYNDRNGKRFYKNPYWREVILTKSDYIRCRIGDRRYLLHRIVYYAHNQDWNIDYEPRNNMIDHIDQNKKNNHISNLRVGTQSLNQQNRSAKYVKGYSWDINNKTYNSRIKINTKLIHLGCFDTEEEARQAYLDAKKIHHKW
jgi:hypothetical protein